MIMLWLLLLCFVGFKLEFVLSDDDDDYELLFWKILLFEVLCVLLWKLFEGIVWMVVNFDFDDVLFDYVNLRFVMFNSLVKF